MNDSNVSGQPWQLPGAEWRFFVRKGSASDALRWTWRAVVPKGATWVDDHEFDTLQLCQADAATHGFKCAGSKCFSIR